MAVAPARPVAPEAPSSEFSPSPAGPVEEGTPLALPPAIAAPTPLIVARFLRRPLELLTRAAREHGQTFRARLAVADFTFVSHPDHVKSLFTAKPVDVPSLAARSPLRPILGPNSVLTANDERHLRQRKLLLPPFHGDAVARYVELIRGLIAAEVDTWRPGETLALAPRMQAVTLDVILAGVFGITGGGADGSSERALRDTVRSFLGITVKPWWPAVDALNIGRTEPVGPLKAIMDRTDAAVLRVIAERRAAAVPGADILSLLLTATDEDGVALSDREIRDELLTLVLAGHETTAHTLAWAFERLVRSPDAYRDLRDAVRGGDGAAYVDATIYEAMRNRPVIPMVARAPRRPWRFGEHVVGAGTAVSIAIVLTHHRPDVYSDPYRFLPERFLGRKPGTYTWIPFGGGTRRCLGATLALAEMRAVLSTVAERTDLTAVTPEPEKALHRNVTIIPEHGGTVRVAARRS